MSMLYSRLKRLLKEEYAPTMAEYGLLLLFIALAVMAGALTIGNGVSTLFDAAGSAMGGATLPTIP
jgi:Flp pilus assembly pilin Flp